MPLTIARLHFSSRIRSIPLLAFLISGICVAQTHVDNASLLDAMFQTHAVLQRDAPIRVWGHSTPLEELKIEFASNATRVRAADDGRWEALLPSMHAGGPYVMTVVAADGKKQILDDVLIGDVWLCSGQSNMVLQVKRSLDSRAEIADAYNRTIRMLTVGEKANAAPLESFAQPVQWLPTTPETVPEFSATCFYFARELQKKIPVPMGLINAAWGGSRLESWISAAGVRSIGQRDDDLDILAAYAKDPIAASGRWGDAWKTWWHSRPSVASSDEPWNPARSTTVGWRAAPRELIGWQQWHIPELEDFTGLMWYRTTLKLSARQAAQDAVLAIGTVDEIDQTFVNGRGVGSNYIGAERNYALPRGLLHAGDNLIAINVVNTYKDGGLIGPASTRALRLADGSSVPLDGAWQYRKVPKQVGWPPSAPWQSAQGLTTSFNGMIAPLGRWGLRGIVWYQGESNTSAPEHYHDLLRVLRSDWRARFGDDLPFLLVQLAAYGAAPTRPNESGWAQLREAQRQFAAEDARTGLAVAIDIGDRYDIHPPNKQEVGRRLARVARHVIYGETALPPSGPVPLSAKHEGDGVVIAFADVTNGLVAYGADGPIGFELCGAQAASCHYASAEIHSNSVTLRAANAATAARVRYGWADSPVVTLFDGAGLPAGPFELPIPTTSAEKK